MSICENETFVLNDNTAVSKPGTYYETLKTTRGCDSVIFYDLKVIKLPGAGKLLWTGL